MSEEIGYEYCTDCRMLDFLESCPQGKLCRDCYLKYYKINEYGYPEKK